MWDLAVFRSDIRDCVENKGGKRELELWVGVGFRVFMGLARGTVGYYRILNGKCARTVFTHELWRIRNRTSERSERVRFLIQNNECVNTVQSTFHVVLCLLYTSWDWTPSLNYDKLYLNKCGQTTITERKQLRKKGKSSNKIQNLWNNFGLSEFKAV